MSKRMTNMMRGVNSRSHGSMRRMRDACLGRNIGNSVAVGRSATGTCKCQRRNGVMTVRARCYS